VRAVGFLLKILMVPILRQMVANASRGRRVWVGPVAWGFGSRVEMGDMETVKSEQTRRDFLATAVGIAAGAAAVAAGAAKADAAPPGRKHRFGMVIDLQRCIACRSCTIACKVENQTPPGVFYNWYATKEFGEYPYTRRKYFSRPCMHCAKPACIPVCPVDPDDKGHRATWKREEDGIVIIDYNRCIGCGNCVDACPYGARYLDDKGDYVPADNPLMQIKSGDNGLWKSRAEGHPAKEKARKCTFCLHKQDEAGNYGSPPACALTCMGRAIHFGDLDDPASGLQQMLVERNWTRLNEEKGTEPSVYYLL